MDVKELEKWVASVPDESLDEFGAKQVTDHCILHYLGALSEGIKEETQIFMEGWLEIMMEHGLECPLMPVLKLLQPQFWKSIKKGKKAKKGGGFSPKVKKEIQQLYADMAIHRAELLRRSEEKEQLTMISVAVQKHMIKEETIWSNGGFESRAEAIAFATTHSHEEAGATAQSLDPTEVDFIHIWTEIADRYLPSSKNKDLKLAEQSLKDVDKAGKETLKTKPLMNIPYPMIAHVAREDAWLAKEIA